MKKNVKKAASIHPFWVIYDWVVNYMEIQDFFRVTLYFFAVVLYTWNTENILENCKNVHEKVLEKCLNFCLKSCTNHVDYFNSLAPGRFQFDF